MGRRGRRGRGGRCGRAPRREGPAPVRRASRSAPRPRCRSTPWPARPHRSGRPPSSSAPYRRGGGTVPAMATMPLARLVELASSVVGRGELAALGGGAVVVDLEGEGDGRGALDDLPVVIVGV